MGTHCNTSNCVLEVEVWKEVEECERRCKCRRRWKKCGSVEGGGGVLEGRRKSVLSCYANLAEAFIGLLNITEQHAVMLRNHPLSQGLGYLSSSVVASPILFSTAFWSAEAIAADTDLRGGLGVRADKQYKSERLRYDSLKTLYLQTRLKQTFLWAPFDSRAVETNAAVTDTLKH